MSAKTTAAGVANYFLDKAAEEGVQVTHLKIQKIVYFAYAWYVGNYRTELFAEDIEAWQFGPVLREFYIQFRDCGYRPIHKRAEEFNPDTNAMVEARVTGEDVETFLNAVWETYKDKTPSWLVSATHNADEPWSVYVKEIGEPDKRPIPSALIEAIYRKKVDALDAA